MKKLVKKVMEHRQIALQPPVLVDVGASGSLPDKWEMIAPYSICIAFDADTRDFDVKESASAGYKMLYSLNRLVAAESSPQVDFYLTASPYCSSALKPDNESLKPWAFRHLFDIEEKIQMPSVSLSAALSSCGIDYIDWYKTDVQGADLRIFDALPDEIKNYIAVAEFEPGIIDAYHGEDKLYNLMSYMDKLPFWVSNMNVKGSQWISEDDLSSLGKVHNLKIDCFLKTAPGWCEISYINKFNDSRINLRQYLLGWVFATIQKEHGFALYLARRGLSKFNDPLFEELINFSKYSLNSFVGYFLFGKAALLKLFKLNRRHHV
jgi:hypothetical protein